MKRKLEIQIEMPKKTVDEIQKIADIAGFSINTVVSVMLALKIRQLEKVEPSGVTVEQVEQET